MKDWINRLKEIEPNVVEPELVKKFEMFIINSNLTDEQSLKLVELYIQSINCARETDWK